MATVSISALFEALLFRQMRATLAASFATDSERTATELLSLVCDAIVTLDDGLLIKKPSVQLAALLFRDTAQGLRGVDFLELLNDADGDRFQAFMADTGRAQCLHVHLRDASGTPVPVQLFHSRFRGVGGQTFRLLGIREESDGERTRRPPDAAMSHSVPIELDVCRGTLREGGASDLSSQSSHGTVSFLSTGDSDSEDIAFAVDAASPRLTLMSCTPAFTALSGPECGDVLDWVVGDNAAELCRLVHRARIGARSRSARVVFEMPHSLCAGKFRAWCTACILDQDSRDGRVCVRVTLTEVRFRRRQRTPRSTGTRRRPLQRASL